MSGLFLCKDCEKIKMIISLDNTTSRAILITRNIEENGR
jgi:hypothetical protein